MVDPEYTIVIENRHFNNYLKADMDKKVLVRWNVSITKLIETLLEVCPGEVRTGEIPYCAWLEKS